MNIREIAISELEWIVRLSYAYETSEAFRQSLSYIKSVDPARYREILEKECEEMGVDDWN